ncbi:ribosome-associated translation inhibitor RaiA [Candidatus Acetothermia bacterium]|nr:ribosome-associated translation inhibitor RaiA [Candidatus Acetothermia bacterium]MBI3642859.1 ribosome-associated translation inhibitor RaiA [Candidatus Acetothermia bacterium]
MKISISKRRSKVSEALQRHVLEKVEQIERHFPNGVITVDIVLDAEKGRQIVEMVAHLIRKKVVRASAETDDLQAAVDAAVEKLKTQIMRHKDQLQDKRSNEAPQDNSGPSGDNHIEILRTQMYLRKPMTPEEAILQLESYGKKNFLVFMDAERQRISILHRLSNGQYEVIEPVY